MSSKSNSNQSLIIGLAVAASISLLAFLFYQQKETEDQSRTSKKLDDAPNFTSRGAPAKASSDGGATIKATAGKTLDDGSKKMDEKELHAKIEEMDKKGKALFKNKQFLEAAQAFTEALKFIEQNTDHSEPSASTSLNRQIVTLINNRSAMYEKGSLPELALEDCNKILEVYERHHVKARTRKLRILEHFGQYYNALVEVCALQLLYMQQNRDNLRMGLPASSPPPVPQAKLEELISLVLPDRLKKYEDELDAKKLEKLASLPSDYTLLQLLKSFTGYNSWMAKAAKDGSVSAIDKQLADLSAQGDDTPTALADRASLLFKKGRRYVYDGQYQKARQVFLEAYDIVDGKSEISSIMNDDDYTRLLEWTAMVKHWAYDLDGAGECYKKCVELEPHNTELLVKQAGVAMDGGKHAEALKLFQKALDVDPNAVDALLHRANLRMLQQNLRDAQTDLERCVELRSDHVLAHLRLATVLTSQNDADAAQHHLQLAERVDPDSSEVQSYRGELLFTQNEFANAKEQFEKAMKLEPKNPTPYVNAALAVLNTPPSQPGQQIAIAQEACSLLEKAIKVDPQFHAAYAQLGQLKLGTATDLAAAREVIKLYDQGLENCRSKDELKDLCSMRLLTQAQLDAATMLKMETFNMQ